MDLIGNNPILAAGAYTLKIDPGQRYVLSASSQSWVGTVEVGWVDAAGNVTPFEESPLSASGGFEFVCPSGQINIVTSDDATIYLAVVPVK